MWETLIFNVISAAEKSNKFQKTRFWKEKSVEDVITLGSTAQATLADVKKGKLICLFNHVHDIYINSNLL
jgi:hypothetical protein